MGKSTLTRAPVQPATATRPATELRAGALGLREVIMQAVGHIGPAGGTLTSLAFITTLAGLATPVTYIFGGAICLLVALALTQLARKIHGAGGYFTYVGRTVGPRAGFITAWLYFLYDPLVTDPEGIITHGHGNATGRQISIHEGDPINRAALLAMFREIVGHNRAGGWRALQKADRG